ncbi:cobalt transporter CbiM [Magnetococcales bacterium HHB-1]
MHIPDGVVSPPLLIGATAVTLGLTTLAVRRMDPEKIPQAAVLAAVFFVISLITVPVGPSSVHLLLVALMGLILKWVAVPTILVALLLQAIFFGFGGVTVLGINTLNMAIPALICGLAFARPIKNPVSSRTTFIWATIAGACGVLMCGAMVVLTLGLSGEAFLPAAKIIIATFLPLAVVEGLVTGFIIGFLKKVKPELLTSVEVYP